MNCGKLEIRNEHMFKRKTDVTSVNEKLRKRIDHVTKHALNIKESGVRCKRRLKNR